MAGPSPRHHYAGPYYGAGVAASLIAEAVFLLMVAGVAWLRDMDPWRVVRMPASLMVGPEAVNPPGFVPEDVLLGWGMHIALSIIVGLLYAFLLFSLDVSPLAGGLLVAGFLYFFGFWILPLVFRDWLAPFWLPPLGKALQLMAHTIYGIVLGISYRSLSAERRSLNQS